MSVSLAQNSTFSFSGTTYTVTSVTVDAPQPEIVNMTGVNDPVGMIRMVPTGSYSSPGRISIEGFGFNDPKSLVGTLGQAVFSTPQGSVTRNAICDSATVDAQVGQVLRIRMTLMPTDHTP